MTAARSHVSRAGAGARDGTRSLITGDVGLGEALRAYRVARGLSVRAAGDLVGGSHWVWAHWESGAVPGPVYLRRIATCLGLSEIDVRVLAGPDPVRRPESVGEQFSGPLARARLATGQSSADLARRLHVSPALISRWESGARTPAQVYWPPLARALQCDPELVRSWYETAPAPSDTVALAGLHALRESRQLSRRALARAVGVDVSTLQRWERAGRVPVRRGGDIASALGVDLSVLARPLRPARPVAPRSPLRALRLGRGLSVDQAARGLAVSASALLSWERGAAPMTWVRAREVARLYAVPVDRIFAAARLDPPEHLNGRRWRAEDLPAILRELRRWNGLTQREFAGLAGVSLATVAGWETGAHRPRHGALRQVDERLQLAYPLSDLLHG